MRRKRSRKSAIEVRERFMVFCNKMIFPLRRVWLSLSARVKSRKNGAGLLKLHDDIETCGYQDVKIMWEMLQKSESMQINQQSKRKRQFWRVWVWSSASHSAPSSSSSPSKFG